MHRDHRHAPRRVRLVRAGLVLLLAFCNLVTGCAAPRRKSFVVPRRCLKIDAQSFTRPCMQRVDGKLLCDGVVVTATCVDVSH
jgi:hypothetical protein